MSIKYLVKLTPKDSFFFGSNKSFLDSRDRTFYDSYIIKSRLFPQQSHILGMVRKTLLEKKGLLELRKNGRWISSANYQKALNLAGGIDKNANEKESLGVIESISPIFIIDSKNESYLHFIPKDTNLNFKPKENIKIRASFNGIKRETIFFDEKFEAKEGLKLGFGNREFWSKYLNKEVIEKENILKIDKVFREVWSIGIKRSNKIVKEDEEGSLYKKCSYKFENSNFHFGFILELSDETIFRDKFNTNCFLGAERSYFSMEITKSENDIFPQSKANFSKAILLSDMFVDEEFFTNKDFKFIINEGFTPFARIKINAQDDEKHTIKKNKNGLTFSKSKEQNLLPKTSVIFTDEELKVDEDDFYTKIGYNKIIYI